MQMSHSRKNELTDNNFKRISVINWSLAPLLMFFFSWPFFRLGEMADSNIYFNYAGTLLFAFGFSLTILHGHVSVAIGSLHRHLYYKWLTENKFTYGFLFTNFMTKTSVRLSFILIAVFFQIAGIIW